ncbi:uncharacterized protein LOC126990889 [Eriocheir sinensis]|uniref:uncharacterized protein LOC126990889 n=1 Tax=Eriocheir sinensis TaxID=95602 RepID=UPI0021C93484|nr:uncharacterized protein LOC126990889 [Eriocheir sinensis]
MNHPPPFPVLPCLQETLLSLVYVQRAHWRCIQYQGPYASRRCGARLTQHLHPEPSFKAWWVSEAVVLSESLRLCLVCDEQVEQHAALRKGNIQSASSGCGRCWGVPGCWGEASGCRVAWVTQRLSLRWCCPWPTSSTHSWSWSLPALMLVRGPTWRLPRESWLLWTYDGPSVWPGRGPHSSGTGGRLQPHHHQLLYDAVCQGLAGGSAAPP